jgi:nucleoporin GLE1
MKKFKFSIQKAVNTLINAISAQSGSQLRDKLQKLTDLVNGRPIRIGEETVTTTRYPGGVAFCQYYIARKIAVSLSCCC